MRSQPSVAPSTLEHGLEALRLEPKVCDIIEAAEPSRRRTCTESAPDRKVRPERRGRKLRDLHREAFEIHLVILGCLEMALPAARGEPCTCDGLALVRLRRIWRGRLRMTKS